MQGYIKEFLERLKVIRGFDKRSDYSSALLSAGLAILTSDLKQSGMTKQEVVAYLISTTEKSASDYFDAANGDSQ